jgi:hypothetical protein
MFRSSLKRMLMIDMYSTIESINHKSDPNLIEEVLECLVGTKWFPMALKDVHTSGNVSKNLLELCYIYSKSRDTSIVLKRMDITTDEREWLEWRYWTHRNRLDLSKPLNVPLQFKPKQRQLQLQTSIDLKMFKKSTDYYKEHSEHIEIVPELFANWISSLLLYSSAMVEVQNIIWEFDSVNVSFGWDEIVKIYSAWLKINGVYIFDNLRKEHSQIGRIFSQPSTNKSALFTFHKRISLPKRQPKIKSPTIQSKIVTGFYNWIRTFVRDEALIRDAMLSLHLLHHRHSSHLQTAELLYSYFNDPLLDPLMELLFLKSHQTDKLEAFRSISNILNP